MSNGLNPVSDESKLRNACETLEAFTFGGLVGGHEVAGIRTLLRELYTARADYDDALKDAYEKSSAESVAGKTRDAENACRDAAKAKEMAERRLEGNTRVCTNLRTLIEGYRSLVASSREMAR